jgi:hypothetical protein
MTSTLTTTPPAQIRPLEGETPHRRHPGKLGGLARRPAPATARQSGVEVGCGTRVSGASCVAQESNAGHFFQSLYVMEFNLNCELSNNPSICVIVQLHHKDDFGGAGSKKFTRASLNRFESSS